MLEHDVTSIRFEPGTSLGAAIGTEKGKVMVYDMRYPVPVHILQHHYRLPIHAIKYH